MFVVNKSNNNAFGFYSAFQNPRTLTIYNNAEHSKKVTDPEKKWLQEASSDGQYSSAEYIQWDMDEARWVRDQREVNQVEGSSMLGRIRCLKARLEDWERGGVTDIKDDSNTDSELTCFKTKKGLSTILWSTEHKKCLCNCLESENIKTFCYNASGIYFDYGKMCLKNLLIDNVPTKDRAKHIDMILLWLLCKVGGHTYRLCLKSLCLWLEGCQFGFCGWWYDPTLGSLGRALNLKGDTVWPDLLLK